MLSSKLTPTDCFCIVRKKIRKRHTPHPTFSGNSLCYVILHYCPLIFEDKQIKNSNFWNSSCEKEVEGAREMMWERQGPGLPGLDQTCWPKVWFVCKCTRCLVSLWITIPLQGKEGTICSHPEPWADSHLLPAIKLTQPQKPCARTQTITTTCKRQGIKCWTSILGWLTAPWGSGRSLEPPDSKICLWQKTRLQPLSSCQAAFSCVKAQQVTPPILPWGSGT